MSRQYKNFKQRLEEEYECEVTISENDFITSKIIEFKCANGHESKIKNTSFINKLSILTSGKTNNICATCIANNGITARENMIKDRCESLGFKFISLKNRNVTYKCVCGEMTLTHESNMLKEGRTSTCGKCQNDAYRRKDSEKVFREAGCEMLGEYKSRHDPVKYRCSCGNVAKICLGDLLRGRRCNKCGIEKRVKTCIEKYGVPNAMHCPELFRKSVAASFRRKEFMTNDGRKYMILGYEDRCLDTICNEEKTADVYAGEDVELPVIKYEFEGKTHVYYPDIYIPSQNRLIEVKSKYTYDKEPEKMKAKMLACAKKYDVELWIYDPSGDMRCLFYFRNSPATVENS